MTSRVSRSVLAAACFLAGTRVEAGPLSRRDLLALVDARTDASSIVARVKKDCVDFEIDGPTLGELCGRVPPEVLVAAIECRVGRPAVGKPAPAPIQAAPAPAPTQAAEPPAPTRAPVTAPPVARAPAIAAPVDFGVAWLRISSPSLKGGCYLFVDYKGSVSQLRVRGTLTTGWRLGSWESDFEGEQLWRLSMEKTGASKAAGLPAGSHTLTLYCDGRWLRIDAGAELVAGRVHDLVIESKGDDSIAIQGVRLEPPDTPPPTAQERVYPRIAE